MDLDGHPFRAQVMLLLQTALVLFIFTVVVGILNGTDAIEFDRQVLLTHVHVGTLGWITMGAFAATLWLFASPPTGAGAETTAAGWRMSLPRVLTPLAAVSIFLYAVAFLTTFGYARPILGTVVAIVIVGYFVWAVAQAREVVMSTPRWGFLAAIATSVTGGVLGVLWGILIASEGKAKVLPEGGEGAHPGTMVVGFLVPLGMSLAEWWLRPADIDEKATRGGFIQMLLLFAGGFSLMLGVLLDALPLIMLNLPFEIAAVIMFLVRNWKSLSSVSWAKATTERFMVASSIAIVLNIGMLVYLISKYAEDFEKTPANLLLALDHLMFIGVITNAMFGFIMVATAARRTYLEWSDQVIFWCINAGIGGFWIGLLADVVWMKRIFTPIMGVGILLGIAVYLMRSAKLDAPELSEASA